MQSWGHGLDKRGKLFFSWRQEQSESAIIGTRLGREEQNFFSWHQEQSESAIIWQCTMGSESGMIRSESSIMGEWKCKILEQKNYILEWKYKNGGGSAIKGSESAMEVQ